MHIGGNLSSIDRPFLRPGKNDKLDGQRLPYTIALLIVLFITLAKPPGNALAASEVKQQPNSPQSIDPSLYDTQVVTPERKRVADKVDLLAYFLLSISDASILLSPEDKYWKDVQSLNGLMNSAQYLLSTGKFKEAEISANEGLRRAPILGSSLARLGYQIQDSEDGKRYHAMLDLVLKLRQNLDTELSELPYPPDFTFSIMKYDELITQSKHEITGGIYQRALEYLRQAKSLVVMMLRTVGVKMSGFSKITFATPQQELLYDQKLNNNFSLLIGVMVQEREISQDVQNKIRLIISENKRLIEASVKMAELQDYSTAIIFIKQANIILGKALQSIGPQYKSKP